MTIICLLALLMQVPAQAGSSAEALKAYEEGKAAYEKQENDKALAAYDRAIALDGKNADFHRARGQALARLQRQKEAVDSCSKALELRADDAAALIDRGHYYINLKQLDLALADLNRVEAMKKDDYGLFYHLALARYLTGDFAKAAETYDGCIRTAQTPDNRTSCQAWQFLALTRAGRKADAQKLLDGFAPDPNQAPSAYIDRLLLFKGVKTEEEVAKTMEKDAIQLPTVAYSIGIWHLLNGREPKAREYFEKAITPPAQQSAFGAVASSVELGRMKQ
ncbi:MAG TPA: tetratricopeptide repeat protein [Vicinamibacterales bacterium]|jgi:tetratricopeptide (TPR) repeat protein|nr:tetratricopeptide repeat protein [Vicinamibacterales bacterium]